MHTRKKKMFTWSKKSCKQSYFTLLRKFLDKARIPSNTGTYTRAHIRKDKNECAYIKPKDCELDTFHSGKKYTQIILGRYQTTTCFAYCKNYYTFILNIWSVFKNDMFIHKIISSSDARAALKIRLPLDPIFPIRIVVSSVHAIKPHKFKLLQTNINAYTNNTYHNKKTMSNKAKRILTRHFPALTRKITASSITSREICMLKYAKLYLYAVKDSINNTYLPYIFASKYNISFIRSKFKHIPYNFEYI